MIETKPPTKTEILVSKKTGFFVIRLTWYRRTGCWAQGQDFTCWSECYDTIPITRALEIGRIPPGIPTADVEEAFHALAAWLSRQPRRLINKTDPVTGERYQLASIDKNHLVL